MASTNLVDLYEGPEMSPYLRLRLAKVVAVHFQAGGQGTRASSDRSLDDVLGRVDVQFVDYPGSRTLIPLVFPSFSNPIVATDLTNPASTVSARCYGDISLPSVGDLVLIGFRSPSNAVVIGSLATSYFQQTSTDSSKSSIWGTIRAIQPGEMSRLSAQQAELYHDRAGAVQIVVKAQPVSGNALADGSATSKAGDIDPTQVPKAEIARVTVGECYTDETFATRDTGSSGNKLVLRVKMASGAALKIDTAGNVEVTAAPGQSLVLNGGSSGVARLNDNVKSTVLTDSTFWSFVNQVAGALSLTPPTSMTAQVSSASQTVKAG